LCILAAYYASADIVTLIDKHPGFTGITSILIFVYGIVMMVTKTKMHIPGEEKSLIRIILKRLLMVFSLIFKCRSYPFLAGNGDFCEKSISGYQQFYFIHRDCDRNLPFIDLIKIFLLNSSMINYPETGQ
jgi:hypothetical protein